MTAAEAAKWAESRACRECRNSDQPEHPACSKAQETAELIRRLADQVN